ncbi:MAG: hypothetical protein A2Z34_06380 [Planctomycetes bacterium RBG_16_59_8]|nr:MAG: hypothetical protein A2Z34_06380 [Planctomycetes bacterium RBG_16_59_8]
MPARADAVPPNDNPSNDLQDRIIPAFVISSKRGRNIVKRSGKFILVLAICGSVAVGIAFLAWNIFQDIDSNEHPLSEISTKTTANPFPGGKDPDVDVSQTALEALKKVDPETCATQSIALLQNNDRSVQYAAAMMLGEVKSAVKVDRIIPLLRSEEPWTRAFAAVALGRISAKECAKELLPLLRDSDPRVRCAAANALGEMSAREHIGNIRSLLADPAPDVKEIAQKVLERLNENH